MQRTATQIYKDQSLIGVEDHIATVSEVFRLQGEAELAEAEQRVPAATGKSNTGDHPCGGRGTGDGQLTAHRPKCMIAIAGKPLLQHIAETLRAAGITDTTVVRGYQREAVNLDGLTYYDNEDHEHTHEAASLHCAREAIDGPCIICYGDVLFKRHVIEELMEVDADFAIMVDINWAESRNRDRYADYVTCSSPPSRSSWHQQLTLVDVANEIAAEADTRGMDGIHESLRGRQPDG